ncbi:hypothetical protein ACWIG4_30450 [Streptomyces sp. NPDC002248]
MTTNHLIRGVVQIPTPNGWMWGVESQVGDEPMHLSIFPPDTLEWRAAEYGFDLETEFDQVLDLVLHSRFIPNPMDIKNFETDAAAQQGYTVASPIDLGYAYPRGTTVPVHLYNAPSIEQAREAQLIRLEAAKQENSVLEVASTGARTLRASSSLLQAIREGTPIEPESIEAKRLLVEQVRESLPPLEEPTTLRRAAASLNSAPLPFFRPMRDESVSRPVDPDHVYGNDEEVIEGK